MTTNINTPTDGDYILVVESNYGFGSLLAEAIAEETSYQTVIATNAYEAAAYVEKSKPAMLILGYDVFFYRPTWVGAISFEEYQSKPEYMPQWINAISLYDCLRKCKGREDMPAVLITQFRDECWAAKSRGIAHCEKGFELNRLFQLIKENLKRHLPLAGAIAA